MHNKNVDNFAGHIRFKSNYISAVVETQREQEEEIEDQIGSTVKMELTKLNVLQSEISSFVIFSGEVQKLDYGRSCGEVS